MSGITNFQGKLLWAPSLALLSGFILYALLRPEAVGIISNNFFSLTGSSVNWLHQHLPDALWAFAFSYCLLLYVPLHTKKWIKILLAFLLPILAECFQWLHIAAGTFDIMDILSICFGTLCSIVFLNLYKK